ncbi:MAG: hypothetical protein RSB65_05415 [Oscillospiraceae bacterium]
MRQAKLLALMIALLLLAGCSKAAHGEEKFLEWRDTFSASKNHEARAELSVEDGEKHGKYTLLYSSNEEEETVEILEPELIAGVRAHIKNKETSLQYDGVMLETGSELSETLSPMMALPSFAKCLREGHLERVWTEEKEGQALLVGELEMPDGSIMTLWLEEENLQPAFAAIREGDTIQIKIKFCEFR